MGMNITRIAPKPLVTPIVRVVDVQKDDPYRAAYVATTVVKPRKLGKIIDTYA